MRFSIIVPVYKIEKYLVECIESVLEQEFTDYEIILVDDGSPDDCPRICDSYAEKNSKIVVIHKENGGISDARNAGIKKANGEFIIFLDGDDVLYKEALKKIDEQLKKNNSPDLFICNILNWHDDEERIIFDNKKLIEYSKNHSAFELCEKFVENNAQIPWRSWESVYKTSFIKNNNLLFNKKIICAEDCDFFFRVISKISSYVLSDVIIIKYRILRKGSVTSNPSLNSVKGEFAVFKKIYESFSDSEIMKEHFADRFTGVIVRIESLEDKKEKIRCLDYVKKNEYILSDTSKSKKYLFARIIWKIFGFNIGNKILVKIKKFI